MPVSLHRPVLFFLNMTKPVIWVVYSQITERYSRRPLILHQYLNSLTIDCDQTYATHSLSHSRQPLPGQIRQSVTKLSGSRADDDIKILIRYKTNVQKKNPCRFARGHGDFSIDCMCLTRFSGILWIVFWFLPVRQIDRKSPSNTPRYAPVGTGTQFNSSQNRSCSRIAPKHLLPGITKKTETIWLFCLASYNPDHTLGTSYLNVFVNAVSVNNESYLLYQEICVLRVKIKDFEKSTSVGSI